MKVSELLLTKAGREHQQGRNRPRLERAKTPRFESSPHVETGNSCILRLSFAGPHSRPKNEEMFMFVCAKAGGGWLSRVVQRT